MGKIQLLSEEISHKIAAGEVVERPASVVKELVENSLDAQATRIDIRIQDGGQEFVQVSDDGTGIAEDDLAKAFMRHATSKIAAAEDLFAIQSLGFRGEALPSMASVSEMTLTTRAVQTDAAHKVTVVNGELAIVPAASRVGTTVEVRRLFYNTPARYKFLKAVSAERREIADLITKFSIAHPHVAFGLWADGQQVLQTTGSGKQLDAIAASYGWTHAKQLLPLEYSIEWGSIQGHISPPSLTKGNRRDQLLILNGRIIQAPSLVFAAERAYQGMLPQRRFPFLVLCLRIDPSLVDVNVHPAKSEVRFQQEREIGSHLHKAVRDSLLRHDLSPNLEEPVGGQGTSPRQNIPPESQSKAWPGKQKAFSFGRSANEAASEFWVPNSWAAVDSLMKENTANYNPERVRPPLGQRKQPNVDLSRSHPSRDEAIHSADSSIKASQSDKPEVGERSSHKLRDELLNGRVIGQLYQSYILLETSEGLWILDQHIVHERLLYERFLQAEQRRPPVQQILPVTLEFSPAVSDDIRQHLDFLASLGIEIEEFGPQTFLLRGIPQELSQNSSDWQNDILRIVESREQQEDWQEQAAITMACRGAIKAGDYLDPRQIEKLLSQLAAAENPFTCPHGRPIIVRLESSELLRRFGRS